MLLHRNAASQSSSLRFVCRSWSRCAWAAVADTAQARRSPLSVDTGTNVLPTAVGSSRAGICYGLIKEGRLGMPYVRIQRMYDSSDDGEGPGDSNGPGVLDVETGLRGTAAAAGPVGSRNTHAGLAGPSSGLADGGLWGAGAAYREGEQQQSLLSVVLGAWGQGAGGLGAGGGAGAGQLGGIVWGPQTGVATAANVGASGTGSGSGARAGGVGGVQFGGRSHADHEPGPLPVGALAVALGQVFEALGRRAAAVAAAAAAPVPVHAPSAAPMPAVASVAAGGVVGGAAGGSGGRGRLQAGGGGGGGGGGAPMSDPAAGVVGGGAAGSGGSSGRGRGQAGGAGLGGGRDAGRGGSTHGGSGTRGRGPAGPSGAV